MSAVLALLALYGDLREIGAAVAGLRWGFVALAFLLAIASYGLRFLRWHFLLTLVRGRPVELSADALVYTTSLLGLTTPGKAGEVVRSFYARDVFGVPAARTLPLLLWERVVDGVAMVFFAGLGLYLYDARLAGVWALGVAGVIVLVQGMRSERLLTAAVTAVQRVPLVAKDVRTREEFISTAGLVLRPHNTLPALALAFGVWATQSLVYFVLIVGLGEDFGARTLLYSLFIYPMAVLVGTFALLPFGLGATDGVLVLLGDRLFDLTPGEAVVAAVLCRAALILPPVLAGLAGSAMLRLRLRRRPAAGPDEVVPC